MHRWHIQFFTLSASYAVIYFVSFVSSAVEEYFCSTRNRSAVFLSIVFCRFETRKSILREQFIFKKILPRSIYLYVFIKVECFSDTGFLWFPYICLKLKCWFLNLSREKLISYSANQPESKHFHLKKKHSGKNMD